MKKIKIHIGNILKFSKPLGQEELEVLEEIINERDAIFVVPERKDGLRYSGIQKRKDFVEEVNFIIQEMRKRFPDFKLEGELIVQETEIYRIAIRDDNAIKLEFGEVQDEK